MRQEEEQLESCRLGKKSNQLPGAFSAELTDDDGEARLRDVDGHFDVARIDPCKSSRGRHPVGATHQTLSRSEEL